MGNGSLISGSDNENTIDSLTGQHQGKYTVMEGSIFDCPAPGFYPYESNCLEFYVCLEVLPGVLFAEQLYRCPGLILYNQLEMQNHPKARTFSV